MCFYQICSPYSLVIGELKGMKSIDLKKKKAGGSAWGQKASYSNWEFWILVTVLLLSGCKAFLCSLCFSLKYKDYMFRTSYQVNLTPSPLHSLSPRRSCHALSLHWSSLHPTNSSLSPIPSLPLTPHFQIMGIIPINPCGSLFLFLVSQWGVGRGERNLQILRQNISTIKSTCTHIFFYTNSL